MRLQSPELVGDVVFKNRARLTLNQAPMHLLGGSFRRVVLQFSPADHDGFIADAARLQPTTTRPVIRGCSEQK